MSIDASFQTEGSEIELNSLIDSAALLTSPTNSSPSYFDLTKKYSSLAINRVAKVASHIQTRLLNYEIELENFSNFQYLGMI